MNTITKESIFSITNEGEEIFRFYIPEYNKIGKTFSSPLRADTNPSASIFKSDSGMYLIKDFAEGKVLNAIDFVMILKNIDFYGAMKLINQDLQLGLSEAVKKVDFEGGTLEYWEQYNVTSEVLNKYEVKSWEKFKTNNGIEVRATKTNPIFSFKIADAYKIYMPLARDKKFKHQWVGQKSKEYCNVFGISQLPEHCTTILITEGLKDCIVANSNLNDDGIWAVGIDNVATGIDSKTLGLLKSKCDNLVLSLDIDEKGLEGSSKKSTMYGLRNFILPSILKDSGGKDISDWFQLKLEKQTLLDELGRVLASSEPPISKEKVGRSPILMKLLESEQLIAKYASEEIIYSPPLISHGETPVIREGTINIVQGKYGSHKTRIVELCCSLLLSEPNCTSDFLGLQKTDSKQVTIIYIDTERNLKEEFPTGILSIKNKACIDINTKTSTFRFTSIKSIERSKRLDAVKDFVNAVRAETDNHILVVLDVATDCVADFNSPSESMKLFDYLGNLCDNFNATFLLILHENPNSEKARGHTGTEGANKASTVIHIGFEKDGKNQDTELIKLKFLKIRSAKRAEPLYLVYSDIAKGLILADKELVRQKTAERRQVADVEMVAEKIGDIFKEATMPQKELIEILKTEFECSDNTLKERLKDIEEQQIEITNIRSEPCTIKTHSAPGKATYYELVVQTIEE
ncbi:hypothetical protein [Emticicia sp. SJ17W-69]|uniref:hypothetical protein n=1 Tax=Emticicia sp. SJ17W-69 TaxID=3421657 RepID=UPI003EB81618